MLNKILKTKEETVKKDNTLTALTRQLKELESELTLKYQNFNLAEENYIDIAINEINIVRDKHTVVLKELKELKAV